MITSLDFETRSAVDLRRAGVYRYAEDASTDVLCLAYAIDDGEPELWVPGMPVPFELGEQLRAYMASTDVCEVRAWNAAFERIIWRTILVPRYGFQPVPLGHWYCTAADAAAMALPRDLETCAAVLRVAEQKDAKAWRTVSKLSRPRDTVNGKPVFWTPNDAPELFAELYDYCKQDVRTERSIYKATRRLGADERQVYLLDQKMNDRGVTVDIPLARAIKKISDVGMERANADISDATAGRITKVTQVAEIADYLGVDSVRKSVIRELLEGDHPDDVRRVLEARAEAGRSSVSKIEAASKCICRDGKVRGLLMYHGANTGRWAGRLLQPQNFMRPLMQRPEDFIPAMLRLDYEYLALFHPPIWIAASLMRGILRAAPGNKFYVGDFAGIEARVVNWLAGQADMVELFAKGGKIYERMAGIIFKETTEAIIAEGKESPKRQMGKNVELGAGFGLGAKTFVVQVFEQTGEVVDPKLADVAIAAYRESHPMVVALWDGLNNAAMEAVASPGLVTRYRNITFVVRGAYLWMILPSGRPLAYAAPRIEPRKTPWGEMRDAVTAMQVNAKTRKWERRGYYGGLWTENAVQAIARDLMAGAMLRCEDKGYLNVLTVHDEIVAETRADFGSLKEFLSLMEHVPRWAAGLPIAVEGWEGERYRK